MNTTPTQATISFRGKPETVHNGDTKEKWLKIPELKRSHCDMAAFRSHPKYSGYANSDMFPGMLKRIRESVFGRANYIKLHAIPDGVTVDTSGFLAEVTFKV